MDQRVKDEVLATYAAFAKAFLANDIKAIDKLMQYPVAYIGDGRATLVDSYPVKPAREREIVHAAKAL